ncbi:hypothetical protein PLICRDRAFT_119052 [Plicaturopsis crispa FD-325 SS-3]|uniref:Tubulin nucleotide-binding domain-like protein n=1 Tax=Plicaturopsis crispa FD-325 SS-3 TaxID=944288 RepID=A0A0C9SQI4_PLICR|nr:hypothetical protein PLICRDRAFT_119052 [Plicaturopsis crispa FD-325 SS-3]
MKEILYIQAGSLANYVGTHFWNTQESYFTYGDDEDPIVSHDISFREGLTDKREPILCPRLLVFDRKTNFGTLAKNTALFETIDKPDDAEITSPNGDVVEYRQDPVPKSKYQDRMDDEGAGDSENTEADDADPDIRFWSDFNRVYYIPRTVQRLADVPEWEDVEGNWAHGQEIFQRYDEDTELMDESLRPFVEECDSLQGIQVMHDISTFGSFTDAFLTAFRDEYTKLSSLSFPLLSDAIPGEIDADDVLRKALNDAMCLRNLNELSSMNAPIQSPSTWTDGSWDAELDLNLQSLYHTSAVLSAHIESATLPLRMKGSGEDLSSLCAQLNWQGTTRFSHLSGVFPFDSASQLEETFDARVYDFSNLSSVKVKWSAYTDVSRGFTAADIQAYDTWRNGASSNNPYLSAKHAPAYALPTSYPRFFKSPPPPRRGIHAAEFPTVKALSSLSIGASGTRSLFSAYATLAEDCVRRRRPDAGFDLDDLKELGNDLWTIHDGFADDAQMWEAGEDDVGEDEE